jgi:hypothetical protein
MIRVLAICTVALFFAGCSKYDVITVEKQNRYEQDLTSFQEGLFNYLSSKGINKDIHIVDEGQLIKIKLLVENEKNISGETYKIIKRYLNQVNKQGKISIKFTNLKMANEELISFSKKKPTIHTMFKGAPRPLLYSSRYGSGATCSIKLVLDEVLPSIEVDDVVAKSDAATESSKLLQLMGMNFKAPVVPYMIRTAAGKKIPFEKDVYELKREKMLRMNGKDIYQSSLEIVIGQLQGVITERQYQFGSSSNLESSQGTDPKNFERCLGLVDSLNEEQISFIRMRPSSIQIIADSISLEKYVNN